MSDSIIKVDFGAKTVGEYVLCLGRYESLHKGHAEIIKTAKSLADNVGAKVMLMTYDESDNPRFGRVILSFKERLERAETLGVSAALTVKFDDEFMSLTPSQFLSKVFDNICVVGVVCGFDFHFGKNRLGDVNYLFEYLSKKNIPLRVVDKVVEDGKKVASSAVNEFLKQGDILKANEMLGYAFFVKGVVQEGRKDGRKLGFPTANIKWQNGKCCVKKGVYITRSQIDGVIYKGITNVGDAPTFNESNFVVETYFKGFTGDLYGREIKIEFDAFLRDIRRFDSVEELILQLNKDVQVIL